MGNRRPDELASPNTPDPDRAPIFIVGSGRSGTSLLRQMLNAHPRIYITHEASFYLGSQFVPRRATTSDWLETYFRSLFFAWLGVDAEKVRADLARIHSPPAHWRNLPDGYRAIMRCCARRYGKYRYGDKTPLHSNYLEEIYRDFPDARVIHIVRDPRATIHSLCQMPWAPASVYLNSRYCRRQLTAIARFKDRILEIRLEDLLADRETTLRAVLDFVGEQWHDAVLQHIHHAPLDDMPPYPWLQGALQPARHLRPDWEHGLAPVWVRYIQRAFKDILLHYGYQPVALDPKTHVAGRLLEQLLAILREIPEASLYAYRFIRLIQKLSGRYPAHPHEIQKMMMSLNPRARGSQSDFQLPARTQNQGFSETEPYSSPERTTKSGNLPKDIL